jgi:two-component system NtrC family sensor kinase
MQLAGVLGVGMPLFMTAISIVFQQRALAWDYSFHPGTAMVVWSILAYILLGAVVLGLSFTSWGQRNARPIVFGLLIADAIILYGDFAMVGTLAERGDLTPIVLLLLIGIGTMPFRPQQTLALGILLSGVLLGTTHLVPLIGDSPLHIVPGDKMAFLLVLIFISTGISALLHAGRFNQFRARQAEAELNLRLGTSERKYRSLFESSADGIFVIDRETGRMVTVNPAMEELLGVPAAEFYAMPFQEFVHPDDRPRVLGYHQARMRGEPAPSRYAVQVLSKRSDRPLVCEITIHRTDDPQVTVGAIRDVTEHVEADRQFKDYAHELENKNREIQDAQSQLVQSEKMASLGNLVAGVAHEINTPLGSIHANADTSRRALEILKEAAGDPGFQDVLKRYPKLGRAVTILQDSNATTVTATNRIVGIVKSLRSFARLDEAEFQKVDIHEGLESTLTILHHELKNRVEIVRDFGTLPLVECYPNQLNQVFLNILVNGVQAIASKGTITITTRHEGALVSISIKDTGKGIDPDHLRHVFDPGFTTKGVGVGTGLGLSISYRIIQDHGGRIDVASKPGEGTTFTIRIPVERPGGDPSAGTGPGNRS